MAETHSEIPRRAEQNDKTGACTRMHGDDTKGSCTPMRARECPVYRSLDRRQRVAQCLAHIDSMTQAHGLQELLRRSEEEESQRHSWRAVQARRCNFARVKR